MNSIALHAMEWKLLPLAARRRCPSKNPVKIIIQQTRENLKGKEKKEKKKGGASLSSDPSNFERQEPELTLSCESSGMPL